jgi:hypothetical protein
VVAEGLLGYVESFGGLGHVQVFGQLLKVVKTDQIHGPLLFYKIILLKSEKISVCFLG